MPMWTLLVARRSVAQHRGLVALVLAVQVVAVALAAAFPALLAASEQAGVRQTLQGSLDTGLTITAIDPRGTVTQTVRSVDRASHRLLGESSGPRPVVTDVSELAAAAGSGDVRPYLGELPEGAIRVSKGAWPAAASDDGGVPVAVPRAVASRLGVAVGSSVLLRFDETRLRAAVAALYDPVDRDGATWDVDPLGGAGEDPLSVDPDDPYGTPIDVVGPLLVASGTLDDLGIAATRVQVAYAPDLAGATVGSLQDLSSRLASTDQIVAIEAGRSAGSVNAQTRLGAVLAGVFTQLLLTRTTAAVAGLLLVVLAITVLVQAATLLDAARTDQRALLAARGATRRQLVGLAAWEAVGTAVAALVVGVPLGWALASLLRGAPTAPAAGSWAAGAAVAVVVVAVRLLPRVRAAERAATRTSRSSGLMRVGGDLVLLVLAVVLGWQLLTRPVDPAVGVDPVLVAAPAALVLAGALVALRVVPLVGRAGEVVARRSRGPVGALVGWELSRRSARATATVLLVTLATASATFGIVNQATWLRSQGDQAALVVGAPVRVVADPSTSATQGALLRDGASGTPQPAIRRVADVVQGDADPNLGPIPVLGTATVLGLTSAARAMLDRGRLQQEGGGVIARLRASTPPIEGVVLPRTASSLRTVFQAGEPTTPIAGAAMQARAVLEGTDGLLTTVALGLAEVDGRSHALTARLPAPGMRLVGFQVQVLVDQPGRYRGNRPGVVAVRLQRMEAGGERLAVPAGWTAGDVSGDLQDGLALPVGRDLLAAPTSAAVVGWKPVEQVQSVWTREVAAQAQATRGGRYALSFGSVRVPIDLTGVVARVPGSGETPTAAPVPEVVVVDQQALSRYLVQSGDALAQVDQWWVDVAPRRVDAWLAAHATAATGGEQAAGAVALTEQLTRGPLRSATTQTLHLLLAAAGALGLTGFGVEVIASLGARRRELAQLRAVGLRRGVLGRMLAAESTARVAVGVGLGLALGVLLGALAAPRLVAGPDGGRPVPSVVVVLPGVPLLLLAIASVVVASLAAALIVRMFRGLEPAGILREGEG